MKFPILILFLLIATKPLVVLAQIEIDPGRPTGATVQYFGWDLKGWKDNTSTPDRAATLYKDTPANIVRIPIEAFAHREDGSIDPGPYGPMLKSLGNIRSLNPDVKIFASLKLAKEKTFPAWVESDEVASIFGAKVKRPVPEKYARLVADYVEWLRKNRIAIDFLGLNNEISGALTPQHYLATARALDMELANRKVPKEFRSFQYIGAECFGVATSVRYAQSIRAGRGLEYADIWGTHFYPDLKSGSIDDWRQLFEITRGRPLWHTELHVRSSPEPAEHIAAVRDGLAILFATNQLGAEGYIWWARGFQDDPTNLIRRKAIGSLLGGSCIYTSGRYKAKDNEPDAYLAQGTRVGETVWVWFFNPRSKIAEMPILLKRGIAVEASCEYWAGGNTEATKTSGTLEVDSRNGKYFALKNVPATSIVLLKIDLKNTSRSPSKAEDSLVAERVWRSSVPQSQPVKASLESVEKGVGLFRQADGRTFKYRLNKLSAEDRKIAENAASKKGLE
ncbi:hypothetical protein CA13_53610 [Planctomycetes bacterium CA13]|uniref:Asl1-like glycosyl hydrolase catalytic domain-containing protein n=1 Tax=Novipirellula herctigrandis TaxID=2527986 RepID=A0A5C5Z9L1_9BACT|nr:hypothetical protein CA13_53610 [Planctomycetes bacterium CA13]